MGFLIIIPVGFLLSLIWVLWSVRPQRRPDANDSMQWHRRSMAALDPTRNSAGSSTAGGAVVGAEVHRAAGEGVADEVVGDDVATTDAIRKG